MLLSVLFCPLWGEIPAKQWLRDSQTVAQLTSAYIHACKQVVHTCRAWHLRWCIRKGWRKWRYGAQGLAGTLRFEAQYVDRGGMRLS